MYCTVHRICCLRCRSFMLYLSCGSIFWTHNQHCSVQLRFLCWKFYIRTQSTNDVSSDGLCQVKTLSKQFCNTGLHEECLDDFCDITSQYAIGLPAGVIAICCEHPIFSSTLDQPMLAERWFDFSLSSMIQFPPHFSALLALFLYLYLYLFLSTLKILYDSLKHYVTG